MNGTINLQFTHVHIEKCKQKVEAFILCRCSQPKETWFFIKGTPPLSGPEKFFFRFFVFQRKIYFEVSSIYWTHFEKSNIALKFWKNQNNMKFSMWKQQNFFVLSCFSRNHFSWKKLLFRPHISRMVRDIELKFFPHILDTIWGAYFFLFQKILLW